VVLSHFLVSLYGSITFTNQIKTSKGNRIIIVEYNQVFNANDIEKINFVTYMINADGNDNIVTLMYRIYDKLPQEFKATFEEKFYNELGENIAEIENNKFDIELTKLSKIQVAAQELPITRIVDLHRSITTIKYSIDLDKL
jgi:sporulation protein YlmC with PRC-barrel domain